MEGTREVIVHSRLFTLEDISLVTFEDFKIFCEAYELKPYKEAMKIDCKAYLKMQVADYILNNNDRHEQNWGFFMNNTTGKLTGYCPLFDHDHAFAGYEEVMSQTSEREQTLLEAASLALEKLEEDLTMLDEMRRPGFLSEKQWARVLKRKKKLEKR